MLLTVLADEETGEVIGVMGHPRNRASRLEEDPEGVRVVPGEGQVAVTIDPPEELQGREPNAEYFDALRRHHVVRDGSLVKRDQ
jgi:hypothetical protein